MVYFARVEDEAPGWLTRTCDPLTLKPIWTLMMRGDQFRWWVETYTAKGYVIFVDPLVG